jgi:hypothetical protein
MEGDEPAFSALKGARDHKKIVREDEVGKMVRVEIEFVMDRWKSTATSPVRDHRGIEITKKDVGSVGVERRNEGRKHFIELEDFRLMRQRSCRRVGCDNHHSRKRRGRYLDGEYTRGNGGNGEQVGPHTLAQDKPYTPSTVPPPGG